MKCNFTVNLVLIACVAMSQDVVPNQVERTFNRCKACIKTGKERLGRKGNDEQRVNDCKVPIQKRGA